MNIVRADSQFAIGTAPWESPSQGFPAVSWKFCAPGTTATPHERLRSPLRSLRSRLQRERWVIRTDRSA